MSPNQLIPAQPYDLSYYITDHTDNNTYYVRAVVYDANTGEVLDTQDLTQSSYNSHLYLKRTQAPGDTSGHGRRIVVVATAYEDSGYTTKSSLYQEQSEVYIVVKPGAGMTLGGGYTVDYNIIKEIYQEVFREEIKKLIKAVSKVSEVLAKVNEKVGKIPTITYSFDSILEALKDIRTAVGLIPLDNSVDLAEVLARVDSAIQTVVDKEVTPETDLSVLINSIDDLKNELGITNKELLTKFDGHMSGLHQVLPEMIKKNSKQSVMGQRFRFMLDETEDDKEKDDKKIDIKSLM